MAGIIKNGQVYAGCVTDDHIKEVIKNNIATTIDSTSTKEELASAKDVYDELINKLDNTIILKTADEVNSFDKGYQSFMIQASIADEIGLPNSPSSWWFCIHFSHSKGYKYPSQIAFEYAGLKRVMYRTSSNGVWSNWRKVCTTSVADVSPTDITITGSNVSIKDKYNLHKYCVINGICYVSLNSLEFNSNFSSSTPITTLPKPVFRQAFLLTNVNGSVILGRLNLQDNGKLYLLTNVTPVPDIGHISFSYPVAES